MNERKYIALDVHQATTVAAVRSSVGKITSESIIETKAQAILDFLKSQRGELWVTFEEGTFADWLYDLIRLHVSKVVVCDPRKNRLMQEGTKSDKSDARRLSELLRNNSLKPVYHGENSMKTLKELVRSYVCLVSDSTRAKNRLKAIYRARGIECEGGEVYRQENRQQWLSRLPENGVRRRAERLLEQLDALECLCEQAMQEMLAESQKHKASRLLRSIPGLGPIRTALIMAVVGTPHRFRSKRQFWTYAGLGVVTRDSAEYELVNGQVQRSKKSTLPRGLNRNHNHVLKAVFKSAALTAATRGKFKEYFQDLLDHGTPQNLAMLTVSRKISAITLAVWKKGERFDAKRHRLTKQEG